ncbi:hypothetical protein [Actinotalea fermentans]|uniref:Uncharacterized protein n=1 Tax=Actinotalea fermentans TaxID=43671 RepID=A0A511YXI2_9CELL|nr:hypothetical protein [Actinotalea fermentans]KGM17683.1 hypothetical protein N867_16985 [Actinotalea fermentans ATCC 43279 = JCM 9966 = DSM 3133]GEN79901.1 hypothetical protein AFE02nite_16350 [Actinotalea fermentans]
MTPPIPPWQILRLAGIWALRILVAYLVVIVGMTAVATVVGLATGAMRGPDLWGAVGGLGMVAASYLFWTALLTPVFAVGGTVQGTVVWAAARWSGGSRRACALAGGVSATALSVVFVLVTSEPRVPDLVAYTLVSLVVGALAGWLSARDCTRMVRRQAALGQVAVASAG